MGWESVEEEEEERKFPLSRKFFPLPLREINGSKLFPPISTRPLEEALSKSPLKMPLENASGNSCLKELATWDRGTKEGLPGPLEGISCEETRARREEMSGLGEEEEAEGSIGCEKDIGEKEEERSNSSCDRDGSVLEWLS